MLIVIIHLEAQQTSILIIPTYMKEKKRQMFRRFRVRNQVPFWIVNSKIYQEMPISINLYLLLWRLNRKSPATEMSYFVELNNYQTVQMVNVFKDVDHEEILCLQS